MSAATMNSAASSKQQLKNNAGGKALDGARKQAASPVDGQNKKPSQPKAWQGTNPITNRASSTTPNGTDKPPPKPHQTKTSTSQAHERALFMLANFTGNDATITLKNGEQFTGVFSGGSFEPSSKIQYTLKMAKQTKHAGAELLANGTSDTPNEYVGEGEDHVKVFDKEDTLILSVDEVVTAAAQPTQNGSAAASSFRTDTEISGRGPPMARQRELQRWDPGADSTVSTSLEDTGGQEWDQFAANERMYGVQSTYDENIYTTSINRSNPRFRQQEAEAERIAREIERSAPENAHVAEERRRDAERGDGGDEEAKYSGVQRESSLPKRSAGSYVPPSQRPITGTPTVSGAPYDPAIISSQLAKPATLAQPTEVPAQGDSTALPQPPASAPSQDGPKDGKIETAASSSKKPTETTTEDHVRNVTDAFKVFANNEKLRTRQVQEAKRQGARAEKNVKLNDLKKFAANFKLNSRVPDDLVPILAKDREKQMEIQRKADTASKEEAVRMKEKEKEKAAGVTSPAQSIGAPQTGAPNSADQRGPFGQHRSRASGSARGMPGQPQTQPPRQPMGPRGQQMFGGRPGLPHPIQPLPANMQMPGPGPPQREAQLSPSGRPSLNANAFEFRPVANAFTPSGTSPSPQRPTEQASSETTSFFGADAPELKVMDEKNAPFQTLKRLTEAEHPEDHKKSMAANGGIPQPYRTAPTWMSEQDRVNQSYTESFPKFPLPHQGTTPMQPPHGTAHIPHAHQLPPHLQAPPVSAPSQRQPYMQPHHGPGQPYDQRMQQFGPGGSVQNSPRFPPAQMAFNGPMPMPMPQFAGQQMPGYGMSPSMGYRQPNMQQPGMMMMPHQQHGQMPPMHQGFPNRGPQFNPGNPQMMGGMPMAPQHSNQGFMSGPMPQQQQFSSPMPPHAQPHMPHMPHHPGPHAGGPGGPYNNSPRPPMMQPSGSHQGFQPQQHGAHPPHAGGGPMPPFGPSPGQHFPGGPGGGPGYPMGPRQPSHGPAPYPQMTPRQQAAMPNPGMGGGGGGAGAGGGPAPGGPGAHGDEGK